MSKDVITIDKKSTLDCAVKIMYNNNIKKLPVIDNGKLIGILTMTDVLR